MKNFTVDENYLCSIHITESWSMFRDKKELTDDELVKVLKGSDIVKSSRSSDHPEFAKFRDMLETDGFIKTERNWCNGDSVLKPFKLNGKLFKTGEQFPSGAAIKGHLKYVKA